MFRALLLMLLVLSTLGAVGPEPAGRKEERALAAALDWLVRHQGPDGGWSGHGFAGTCAALVPDSKGVRRSRKAKAFEACEGHAKPGYEVGLTGLALWALVEGGIEPDQERHGEAVRKARVFLLDAQDGETGQFGTRQSHTFLYDHALATLALARLVPLVEGDAETETLATLQKAVYFLARAKNPYSAWGYSEPPNGTNNLSLTVWCLEAGHAARDAGVDVPTSLVESPLGYLDELLDRETGRIGYNQTGSRSSRITGQNDHFDPSLGEAMTAAGLWHSPVQRMHQPEQIFCPECGAPIEFRGTAVSAVCDYCDSTVVRTGVDVSLIGKVSAEDVFDEDTGERRWAKDHREHGSLTTGFVAGSSRLFWVRHERVDILDANGGESVGHIGWH